MIEFSVIQGTRRSGKTMTVLEAVHERAVQGKLAETLIITSTFREAERLTRLWRSEYMSLPDPMILTIGNLFRARGHKFEKVFIEDIDIQLEGIYSDRVRDILPCLSGEEPEVIFTSSNWPFGSFT